MYPFFLYIYVYISVFLILSFCFVYTKSFIIRPHRICAAYAMMVYVYDSSQNIDRCCTIHQWELCWNSLWFLRFMSFALFYLISLSHYPPLAICFFFSLVLSLNGPHRRGMNTIDYDDNGLSWAMCVCMHVETICLLFRLSGLIADYDLFVQFIYETPENVCDIMWPIV